jgi:hypothetical protein
VNEALYGYIPTATTLAIMMNDKMFFIVLLLE